MLLLVFLVLTAVTAFVLLLLERLYSERLAVTQRLEELAAGDKILHARQAELAVPLWRRLFQPLFGRLQRRQAPSSPAANALTKRLALAGSPGGLTASEFTILRYLTAAGGVVIGAALAATGLPTATGVILAAGAGITGWAAPGFYLTSRINRRRQEVQKALPDTLDLLTVSIEAGLGFDGAVQKVVDKTKGTLASEMREMLREIQVGKPRREALRDVADRVAVDDLTTFIGAVVMAEQMGVRIGNVLRTQSDQMRLKRRQLAEERALKAPVKMLFPLIFFIFPATFIVLLGPAALQILRSF
ncbi:MAG: type II secretion system F family protein [Thermoanaerobacterales bacterium]|nr:type II secretion system F family protein [Bacillota bacterium]MDI6906289.1 type II secretion system F family protein [Thermoanaerobacterales bacterium]